VRPALLALRRGAHGSFFGEVRRVGRSPVFERGIFDIAGKFSSEVPGGSLWIPFSSRMNGSYGSLRRMKTRSAKKATSGLTRIELFAVAGVLAVLSICLVADMRSQASWQGRAMRVACCNNLRQIGMAFKAWALDHNDCYPMGMECTNFWGMERSRERPAAAYFGVMANELGHPLFLVCPADPGRSVATNFGRLSNSNLSYFVGVDVRDENPQMFLSGDRNLTTNGVALSGGRVYTLATNGVIGWTGQMHKNEGNVLVDDGSVQQGTSVAPGVVFGTNRIAVP
jgi:hypothetical protein